MKTRLGNTRPATKAPLYYIEKVYIYSVICTQYNTNPYLNKGKVKLYLHLATVSDVLEYCLKIKAFCLFLKTSISLLRLKLNPANNNIIRFLSKWLDGGYYMAARRYEISLRVLKNISRVSAANGWNIFSTQETFRISKLPSNVLFII